VKEILDYLKKNGEQLDFEIARGLGIPIEQVRVDVKKLATRGELVMCRVVKVVEGEKIEGTLYRASGYTPKPKPGRKPNAQVQS
jgi:DNA-binding Lrp family transcriptional regulator